MAIEPVQHRGRLNEVIVGRIARPGHGVSISESSVCTDLPLPTASFGKLVRIETPLRTLLLQNYPIPLSSLFFANERWVLRGTSAPRFPRLKGWLVWSALRFAVSVGSARSRFRCETCGSIPVGELQMWGAVNSGVAKPSSMSRLRRIGRSCCCWRIRMRASREAMGWIVILEGCFLIWTKGRKRAFLIRDEGTGVVAIGLCKDGFRADRARCLIGQPMHRRRFP